MISQRRQKEMATKHVSCQEACHQLRKTNGLEMSNGNSSYRYNWLCDKCNRRSSSITTIDLYRCDTCQLDFCATCSQAGPVAPTAATSPAEPHSTAQFMQVVIPANCQPGGQVQFTAHGRNMKITVPPDARPGQTITVEVPPPPPSPTVTAAAVVGVPEWVQSTANPSRNAYAPLELEPTAPTATAVTMY